jgi:hypothetical protein
MVSIILPRSSPSKITRRSTLSKSMRKLPRVAVTQRLLTQRLDPNHVPNVSQCGSFAHARDRAAGLASTAERGENPMIRLDRPLFCAFLAFACAREPAEVIREVPAPDAGDGAGASAGPSGSAGGANSELGGNTSVAGSTSIGPQLTEASHPGYQQPLCFDCHGPVAIYPHLDSAYHPPDCVACHGNNGAPRRDHAVVANPGCPSCHGTVSHVPMFSAPTDCVKCHGAR